MADPDFSQQLEAPLSLLKSLVERAFRPGQTPSQAQLNGHLDHLQGALDDVVGVATNAMGDLLSRLEEEMDLSDEGLQAARRQLSEVTDELTEQMMSLADAFASATSLENMAAAREVVEGVELAMEGTLARLEAILDTLSLGEDEVSSDSRMEEASEVLDLLAGALESVEGHLGDGAMEHLEQALSRVEKAGAVLRGALGRP